MSHHVTLEMLWRLSIREDLRLEFPDGKTRRAYWMNLDRTRARGEYTLDGQRHYVYGEVVNGRLVPGADQSEW